MEPELERAQARPPASLRTPMKTPKPVMEWNGKKRETEGKTEGACGPLKGCPLMWYGPCTHHGGGGMVLQKAPLL